MSESAASAPYYWVLPGLLLAGPCPSSRDPAEARRRLELVLRLGIERVVRLMEDAELGEGEGRLPDYSEAFERGLAAGRDRRPGESGPVLAMPIPDYSVPSPAGMAAILDAIEAGLAAGRPTLVHCWGGRGRTGTVVGCLLARRGIASGGGALEAIEGLRACLPEPRGDSPETEEQRLFVRTWPRGA